MVTPKYPSASCLITQRKSGIPIPQNSPVVYATEITYNEKQLHQYLWTMYRYEIDNGLTTLDYLVWVKNTKALSDKAAFFLKRKNLFEEKHTIIQPLPSRELNLTEGLTDNHVAAFCVPYGQYDDISVARQIDMSATYASHLLLQNDQSVLTGTKMFESGKIKTMTHVVFGNGDSFDYYCRIMQQLENRLTNNNNFYASSEEFIEISSTGSVKTRTYRRH